MAGSFSWQKVLLSVDQFRMVSKDLTKGSVSGGIFTIFAYALLAVLLFAELVAFLSTTYQTNIVMDPNEASLMQINFDILMHDLPCKYLKLYVWDKFGEERIESSEQFSYIPVDHSGIAKGMAYTKEEIAVLEQVDERRDVTPEEQKALDADWSSSTDQFKHNDFNAAVTFHDFTLVNFFAEWCIHCRKFSSIWKAAADQMSEKHQFTDGNNNQVTVKFMKMNCVDFTDTCQKIGIPAFPNMRLYKRDGTFEVFSGKRTIETIQSFLATSIRNSHLILAKHHAMFNEGCQVRGALNVPRVPGHFYLQAEAFGDVNVNPSLTNVSHKVNHLSFGPQNIIGLVKRMNVPREMLSHLAPLDGKNFIVERFHEAPQHYLKVVSTSLNSEYTTTFYQMTHTDRVRRLRKENVTAAPQARFTWDFSPMSVVVKPKSKRWYEFLTSLFAIIGGTYTICELTSGAVDSVSTVVKEALGKNF